MPRKAFSVLPNWHEEFCQDVADQVQACPGLGRGVLAKEGASFPRHCSHWKVQTPRLNLALLAALCHTALYKFLTQNPTPQRLFLSPLWQEDMEGTFGGGGSWEKETLNRQNQGPPTLTECRFHCFQNPPMEALSLFRPQSPLQKHPTRHFPWSALHRPAFLHGHFMLQSTNQKSRSN